MTEQANVQVVRQLYGAFARGDIPGVLALLTEDTEWTIPGTSASPVTGVHRGRDGVAAFFAGVMEHFDVGEFAPGSVLSSGDMVIALGREQAAPKGQPLEPIDWVHVFTFRGGLIATFREYFDTARLEARMKTR